ncbi:MAG: GGDEF domain-containing protein [Mycobacteriales bacterium]
MLNRRGWERAVVRASSRLEGFGDPTVVVMLDLDRLKAVNDEQGHEAGDAYIRAAGAALRSAVRSEDVVARLGGDEFGVIMARCTERTAHERVARLYDRLADHGVSGSVGWAALSVLRGFPAALAEADTAMYAAKRQRRAVRGLGAPVPRVGGAGDGNRTRVVSLED